MRTKILFLIHDLGQGGAEKVLVNLVNNMDHSLFEIHVTALFGGGVNEQFLKPHIVFHKVWDRPIPGNSKLMKLLTPEQLHRICVREEYDIEVSYLEGPSARVISGCKNPDTKLYCWIHSNQFSLEGYSSSFRSTQEAVKCYGRFKKIVCVSEFLKDNFCRWFPYNDKTIVLYNTVESELIFEKSKEPADEIRTNDAVKLIAVGSLKEVKGFDRLLRIMKQFADLELNVHLYLLGRGPLQEQFETYIREHHLESVISLLGYQTNPYKFVSKCDLFVCSSHSEGFSTAATEALIVGTAVCTVDVSGMREMLGENNEYGYIVPNEEEKLFEALKNFILNPELIDYYKKQASLRGTYFQCSNTVSAVQALFLTGD